ncbi:hypothetical protein Trydic_g10482 [Trypoxylus dichotomus]
MKFVRVRRSYPHRRIREDWDEQKSATAASLIDSTRSNVCEGESGPRNWAAASMEEALILGEWMVIRCDNSLSKWEDEKTLELYGGSIYKLDGITDQLKYVQILNEVMVSHAEDNMSPKWMFMQDTNTKHASKTAKQWFREEKGWGYGLVYPISRHQLYGKLQRIGEIVNEEDFTNIYAAVQRSYTRINGQLKDKHPKKLKSLLCQKESNSVDPRKTVIDLSTKQLDDNTIKILTKGMKFAIAPTRVPTLDMILAVEMAAGKIQPPEAADECRWKVRTAIEKAKPKQIRHLIAKFLLDITSPLSGNTESAITNTKHFINKIKEITIDEYDKLVSFDVTSLFTNVPTEAALAIVRNGLFRNTTLDERTSLNVEAIIELLLSTCVNTTYLQVNNNFHQQEFGTAMGSPLSPVPNNIIWRNLNEERWIHTNFNRKCGSDTSRIPS